MRSYKLKTVVFFAFIFSGIIEIAAQNNTVNKAKLYLENGEYSQACKTINKAVKNSETTDAPRAWFYRGGIYHALLEYPYTRMAENENNANKYRDSVVAMAYKADSSYKTVIELDKAGGKYARKAKEERKDLWKVVVNEARHYLQEKTALNTVLKLGELAAAIKPDDTTSHKIAGMAAKRLQKYDKVLHHYQRLKALEFDDPHIYQTLVVLNQKIAADTAKAFQLAKEGHKKYPDYLPLIDELAPLYMDYKGNPAKSIQYLKVLKEKEPDKLHYRMRLGEAYNKTGNYSEAINQFMKAVKLDSTDFTAQYNLGALYLNYGKEQKDAETQRKYMKNALYHLRKAREIRSVSKLDTIIKKLENQLNK